MISVRLKSLGQKVKNNEEIYLMKELGRINGIILQELKNMIKPGMCTNDLDKACMAYCDKFEVIPSCLGYQGFPKSLCTSVNDQVCHGIPSEQVLHEGDIVNIDLAINRHGMHTDTSLMVGIGNVIPQDKKLMALAYEALFTGIRTCQTGKNLYDIATAIENFCNNNGLNIIREFCGHGVGHALHEDMQVLAFTSNINQKTESQLKNNVLISGLTFTIEPLVTFGSAKIRMNDQDEVYTYHGTKSAYWEHTILITNQGYEILTLRPEEQI